MHGDGAAAAPEVAVVDAVISASRVLVAIAARSLADAGEQVTLTQYRALVILASQGALGIAALAESLAVTPPTASRMCDRLVKKGLVRRRVDPNDRRQVRLSLAASGRELIDTVTARRRVEIADLVSSLTPEDQRSLVSALQRVAEAAGEVPEQHWNSGWDL